MLFWPTSAAVAFVTLSPIGLRPETGLGADPQRFVALAVVSLFLALGHPRHCLAGLLGLAAAAGLLEAVQNLVGGRHGRWHDAEVKVVGAAAGVVLAPTVERTAVAMRRSRA